MEWMFLIRDHAKLETKHLINQADKLWERIFNFRITQLNNFSFDFRRVLLRYGSQTSILDIKVHTDFVGCCTDNDAYRALYSIKDKFVTQVYISMKRIYRTYIHKRITNRLQKVYSISTFLDITVKRTQPGPPDVFKPITRQTQNKRFRVRSSADQSQ